MLNLVTSEPETCTAKPRIQRNGFSLLELLMTIAILGVITGLGASLLSDDTGSARVAKLESDISTLNQMVAIYVSEGGSVAGLTTPQSVLDKMKRTLPQSEWQKHVGPVTGRLVDVRLQARVSSRPDNDGNQRAVWNRSKQRFELTNASGNAVSEFYLDPALASANYGTERRARPTLAFNSSKSGWIWGSSTSDPTGSYLTPQTTPPKTTGNGFDPNEVAPSSSDPPPDQPPGDDSGQGGGGGGGSTPPTLSRLPQPLVSPAGGTFAYSSFPNVVTLSSNGAIPDVSKLMYSINAGPWTEYTGAALPLTPAMNIQVRNETTRPAEYATSDINAQSFYRLISGFSGSDNANWGNALGGTNLVTDIQNGTPISTFKNGNTKLDLGNGEYLDAGIENMLSFSAGSFDSTAPNTWFDLGRMTIVNGTTFYNSEATGVTLSANLSLTQPALNFTTHIDLGLISTTNTSDRLASADAVELVNPTTDLRVTIDGVDYWLELSWSTLDPSSGVVDGNKFLVFEGATAQAVLRARFTSSH